MLEKEKVSEEEYRRLVGKYGELEDLVNELKKGFKSLDRFQKFYGLLLKKVDRIVGKQIEEEKRKLVQENKGLKTKNEELKKENKELYQKVVQEEKEWKRKQEELKKENKILKEQARKEKKEYKEVESKYRDNLIAHFLDLQQTLWEVDEKYKRYEEFFNNSVLPLQILIGLSKEMDMQTKERVDYYIWDVIIEPLIGEIKKNNGEICNGKLVLPESENLFEKEKFAKKIEQEPLEQIERYIKEDERRVELKRIVLQKKQMVEDLGRMLEELKEIAKEQNVEKREILRLAKEVQFLFERNEIYPLFAEELKEHPNSELKNRMIPINSNSIKYPGLFIKRNGSLEVLGTNIGMDNCEENLLL